MQIEITEAERTRLLIALWNDYLLAVQANAPLVGTEHEFDTMMMFQEQFALVEKIGGNPHLPMFGVASASADDPVAPAER